MQEVKRWINSLNEIPLSLMVRLRGHDPYCVI